MTGYVQNNIIAVRQGDSFAINFDLKDKCAPVDLTGATMLMQVRDDSGNLMFSVSGTPVDAVNGKMAILLTPTQTKLFTKIKNRGLTISTLYAILIM